MTVTSVVIALAGVLAAPEHHSRRYVALPSGSSACDLEIDSADVTTLQCHGRPALRGIVHRVNNWLLLDAKPVSPDALSRAAAPDQEYRSAFQRHMRQHFKEHGFYPLIAPPPFLADVPETTGCIMVSVQFRGREFLVDLFERESFCGAAQAGRELQRTLTQHRVFRGRDAGVDPHTLPHDDFCASEWRPLFE